MWLIIQIVDNRNIKFYLFKKYNDETFILKTIKVLDKKTTLDCNLNIYDKKFIFNGLKLNHFE